MTWWLGEHEIIKSAVCFDSNIQPFFLQICNKLIFVNESLHYNVAKILLFFQTLYFPIVVFQILDIFMPITIASSVWFAQPDALKVNSHLQNLIYILRY